MNNQLWYIFIEETYANKDLNKHKSSFKIETLDNILNYNLSMPLRCLNVNAPLMITMNHETKISKNMLFNLQLDLFKRTLPDFKFKSLNKQLSNLKMLPDICGNININSYMIHIHYLLKVMIIF